MNCPTHHVELEIEIQTYDYHDPSDYYGHGQHEEKILVCPFYEECEVCEPYEEGGLYED